MYPRRAARSSGLDISLLGVILAIIGFYGSQLGELAGTMPHLIRFFDVPPGHSSPAVMPQDAALLLLTDPTTTESSTISGTGMQLPVGELPMIIAYVGLFLIVLGPVWAWRNR